MPPKKMIVKFVVTITILISYSSGYDIRRFERLPNSTKPLSYNLHFVTDVHKGGDNFTGIAQIRIQVIEDTDRIVLHGRNFSDVKLNLVDLETAKEVTNLQHEFDLKAEQIIITAEPITLKLIAAKEYLLTISYNAKPCVRPRGFCLFYYEDEEDVNKTIPLAATHLSRGYARVVFPCYDEPALKANFTISVTHGNNYTALSNMPRQGEPIPEADGYVTTKFIESPPMSTYIMAVTVSNYENITERVGDTDVRLFFKPKSKGGRLAFEIAKKALVLMNDYFNISFPLPKIDHFSVPKMGSRGMENWGLITYFEPVLLNDIKRLEEYKFNLKTVTHEMSHMWFGDLVTPAWWSQIWLSEGISTYYGYKFINMIDPELNFPVDYRILLANGEQCSLTCNAESLLEYDTIFGSVPYVKGHFVLTMFETLITEEVIRNGMVAYLQKYQYKSATEDDLLECLADAMDPSSNPYFKEKESLIKAMKSWTTQKYYPAIMVVRNYINGTFSLKQEPYKTLHDGNDSELWWIPITFTTPNSSDFDNTAADFVFPGVKEFQINPIEFGKSLASNEWLILSNNLFGLYRVNYDERNWNLIICALKEDPYVIPDIIKVKMIQDLFELFIEGYAEPSTLFNFLNYLGNESHYDPWSVAWDVLANIFEILKNIEDLPPMENFKQYIENIISNASEIYDADNMGTFNNNVLFKLACDIGLEKCNREMNIIFEKMNSLGNITEEEKSLFLYGACHFYSNSTKEIKSFIEDYANAQDYFSGNEFFSCIKNKDQLKNRIEQELNKTTDNNWKDSIIYNAMIDPILLEAFLELLQQGESELKKLFLQNADGAILHTKTIEHANMLLKAWTTIGGSHTMHQSYENTSKKFKRQRNIREGFLRWLKTDPVITNISC